MLVSNVFDNPVKPIAVQVPVAPSDFSFSITRLVLLEVGVGIAVLVVPEVVLKNVRLDNKTHLLLLAILFLC